MRERKGPWFHSIYAELLVENLHGSSPLSCVIVHCLVYYYHVYRDTVIRLFAEVGKNIEQYSILTAHRFEDVYGRQYGKCVLIE